MLNVAYLGVRATKNMDRRAKEYASVVFVVLSLCAYSASFWLAFKSGCAGDPKAGEGNPVIALQIESQSIGLLVVALVLVSLAYAFKSRKGLIARLMSGVLVAILFAVPSFIAVGYMQGVGVQSCG